MHSALRSKLAFALAATLFGGVGNSDAAVPKDLGQSETRCDDSGCSLGACVVREIEAEPVRLLGKLRVIPNMVNGQPHGFKLFAIRPGSLPHQLGVQNGDVLLSVNNMRLDSPSAALAAWDTLRGVEEITLQLERRGQELSRKLQADRRPIKDGACPPPAPISEAPTAPSPSQNPPASTSPAALQAIEKDIVCAGNMCKLKHGVLDRILDDMTLIQTSGRIVPAMKDGKPIGLKLFAIRPASLFARLQFRNGDLVRSVGGHDITSPATALEAYSKLRTMTKIPVVLERTGKPLVLTYIIER